MTTRSGRDALELYKENQDKIDLVVLDMIMPGMSGGETYDRLKGINPNVKVLLSSGYSMDGQASEILKCGCSGFIQKPFRMRHLSQIIREILDKEYSQVNSSVCQPPSFFLPRSTVTVGSANTLIENFRQFENVKYYLELPRCKRDK